MNGVNKLRIVELLWRVQSMAMIEHYHTLLPQTFLRNECKACREVCRLIEEIERELGPTVKTAKSEEEFIQLIQNDPLSKQLWDIGRNYEAHRLIGKS